MRSIARRPFGAVWARYEWAIDFGYPVPPSVISLYRIGFALYLLVLNPIPELRWMSSYTSDFYRPPPGLPLLWRGVLPGGALLLLEITLLASIVWLLIGWRTRASSLAVGGIGLLLNSIYFSFGKIDHTALLWFVPIAMAWSGWGSSLSIDARFRPGARPSQVTTSRSVFAVGVLLSVSFLTAALPKIAGGWLSINESAVREHFLFLKEQLGRDDLLADPFAGLESPLLWEMLDWATVGLESTLVVALLWPVAQRRAVGTAWLFHISTLLVMNISFYGPLAVYPVFFLPLISEEQGARAVAVLTRRWRWAVAVVPVLVGFAIGGEGIWWAVMEVGLGLSPHQRDLTFFGGGLIVLAVLALRTSAFRRTMSTAAA